MKNDLVLKKIDNVNESDLSRLIGSFDDGIILYDLKNEQLVFANDVAIELLCNEKGDITAEGSGILSFSEEEIERLENRGDVSRYLNDQTVKLVRQCVYDDKMWIRVVGHTSLSKLESQINNVREISQYMRKTLLEYDQSSLMISDSEGIIEFAGEETVENCGNSKQWYLGKSVYELEKEKIFYPSVIKQVLKTGTEQVVIQKTSKSKKKLVAIGIPKFDEEGRLEKVLSITKNYTDEVNLSSIIAKMEFGMDITGYGEEDFENVITCNERMLEIKTLIRLVAPTDSTILILGETGTGKEVIARAIHSLSNRKDKPFVVVSCGSLSPNIVESELFGYEEGAFTGANKGGKKGLLEAANGGTVFLDEIGELPIDQQVKLLHVLQEKCIVRVGGTQQIPLDIRVISATNRDLTEHIKTGCFRQDLYYRLNVVSIELPPLRERREDISLLIDFFAKKFCRPERGKVIVSKSAAAALEKYDWPGNIRELENTIESLMVIAQSNYIEASYLPSYFREGNSNSETLVSVNEIAQLSEVVAEAERQLLTKAYKEFGSTTKIAEAIGVSQPTVSRRLRAYGICETNE